MNLVNRNPNEIELIVCGTDGSPSAESCVRFAARLATQLKAKVLLAHAVGLLENLEAEGLFETPERARDHAEANLAASWGAPLVEADVLQSCVIEDGPPVLVLPRLAQEHGAQLIVVASHGRGRKVVSPLGSTAHGLVQVSPTPVLVVPDRD